LSATPAARLETDVTQTTSLADAQARIIELEARVKAADALADAVDIWQRDGFTVEAAVKMGAGLSIYRATATGEQT